MSKDVVFVYSQNNLYGMHDTHVDIDGTIELGPYAEIFDGKAFLRLPAEDQPFAMIQTEEQDAVWLESLAEAAEITKKVLTTGNTKQQDIPAVEASLVRIRQRLSEQAKAVAVTPSGSLVVPAEMLAIAKLKPGDNATLVGNYDHIELWRSDLFEELTASIDFSKILFGDV